MPTIPNSLPPGSKAPVKRVRAAKVPVVSHRDLVPVEKPVAVPGMLPPPNTGGPARVLAIDPALRNTGWAIGARQGSLKPGDYGAGGGAWRRWRRGGERRVPGFRKW